MPQINLTVLGDRRREAGKLAAATGASEAHIGNILHGRKNPSVELAHRLAAAIGCNPSDLLDIPDDTSPLRRRRQQAGISPTTLARRVRVSYSHLSAVELGHKKPSDRLAADLAAELGCKPTDLFPESEAA